MNESKFPVSPEVAAALLTSVADLLETVRGKRFDIGEYYHGCVKGTGRTDGPLCGSPSCVLGWAGTLADWAASGVLGSNELPNNNVDCGTVVGPRLGLDYLQSMYLFYPNPNPKPKQNRTEVIRRLHKVANDLLKGKSDEILGVPQIEGTQCLD